MIKRILSLILCGALIFSAMALVSCNNRKNKDGNINISVLNGTTGFGIAKLMDDVKSGKSTINNAKITVESDPFNITSGLINGTVDIAALPTNAAANVYNKTGGKIKIVAVNTLGVLYVVANGTKINISNEDGLEALRGKTVYCPAQNPEFIFKALCQANGLEVGKDIIIDTAYAQPSDLRAAVIAGKADIAVLPEPMVTIAKSGNTAIYTAFDLTDEWNKVFDEGSLMQGCIVVRTEWLENNKEAFEAFMREYKASVEFVNTNTSDAARLIAAHGIFTNDKVAERAIPNCNIRYVDGEEMACGLNEFFKTLYSVAPASIGNKLPDENIYYKK